MKANYEKPEVTTIKLDNEISLTITSAPDDPERYNSPDSFDGDDPFMTDF